jgi:hypothetical protein
MPWDKDDYLAAGLIGSIIIISLIVALYFLGIIPKVDTIFPFMT